MKVLNSDKVKGVLFTGGKSRRLVTKQDNMGFAVCETHVHKGGPYKWHYKNHQESCYCVSGYGILENLETGEVFGISPGILYSIENHEPHRFTAQTDVVLISVFNPPLRGDETHDENGNYI